MISQHPGEELLVAYASGASSEAVSLVVATHLALCPECRRAVADVEHAGGLLLDDLDPAPLADSALSSVMSRLNGAEVKPSLASPPARNGFKVPEPLRSYLGGDLDQISWTPMTRGLANHPVLKRGRTTAQLIRNKAGHGIGMHTHKGEEYTLVLAGGYTDETGHYLRGDLQTATPETTHHQVADEGEDCIIFAVADAPLRFRNPLAGLIAKLMGY